MFKCLNADLVREGSNIELKCWRLELVEEAGNDVENWFNSVISTEKNRKSSLNAG
jgi:hypothetical protein